MSLMFYISHLFMLATHVGTYLYQPPLLVPACFHLSVTYVTRYIISHLYWRQQTSVTCSGIVSFLPVLQSAPWDGAGDRQPIGQSTQQPGLTTQALQEERAQEFPGPLLLQEGQEGQGGVRQRDGGRSGCSSGLLLLKDCYCLLVKLPSTLFFDP